MVKARDSTFGVPPSGGFPPGKLSRSNRGPAKAGTPNIIHPRTKESRRECYETST
jgi:hypothetical protein